MKKLKFNWILFTISDKPHYQTSKMNFSSAPLDNTGEFVF